MAPKQTPRRGAKTRAAAKSIVIEEPQPERRSKFRHDPSKRKGDVTPSGTPSKRGRVSSISKGKSPMPSRHPRRKLLPDSSDSSEEDSSSESSDSSEAQVVTPSQVATEGRSILKPRAVALDDEALANAFPELIPLFQFQGWLKFISEFRILYPRLVQEFYLNMVDDPEGFKSEVKGKS
ncbi:hypothetical protein Taro_036156 [Colocasia esculenta]|uniref:Uncharacterized protein n=1 Tax=Colocasia esculenta TaxID=4460 RepID=A0A843VWL3_COLES|nr:hypothetical protein [Colocasia esculenta]